MPGSTDLNDLLTHADPVLDPERYVFVSMPAVYGDHAEWQPVAAVSESKGLTLVVRQEIADSHSLAYDGVFRRITLQVDSSLAAVGLTAAFSSSLAAAGISANVFAGFHHDHVFVPSADAERAVVVIGSPAQNAASSRAPGR